MLGKIGSSSKSSVTIIGDTVNTASRLEALDKETKSQMILSSTVAAAAGLDLTYLPVQSIQVRGRTAPLRIYVIPEVSIDLQEATAGAS